MDDIAALATRIIALRDGKVVADGSPKDVFGDREKAREAGIDLPFAARIADRLAERGIALDKRIITPVELADALAAYRDGKGAETDGASGAETDGASDAEMRSKSASRAESSENGGETPADDDARSAEKNAADGDAKDGADDGSATEGGSGV